MKYLDEYRDEAVVRSLAAEIEKTALRPHVLMEICGGQTHTIMRYGLDQLLPQQVELVHGPGCPVCVTPLEMIDRAIQLAQMPEVTFVSYGDMLRVPGSTTDLLQVKARGGDVRIVYSPLDAVRIARDNPDRKVVFFAIGFETTAPPNAMAVWQAHLAGLTNFSLLVSHVLVPPAIRALLTTPGNRVQGFIAPGHVCTVVGRQDYESLSSEFSVPIVLGGFEPVDLLYSVLRLVDQLERGSAEVENAYARNVRDAGNPAAQEVVARVFEVCPQKWRGIGEIPASGLRLRPELAAYDAERLFDLGGIQPEEPSECIAADVLQGRRRPTECPAFAVNCSPEHPLGAPMVSAEGACSAYHRYRREEQSQ